MISTVHAEDYDLLERAESLLVELHDYYTDSQIHKAVHHAELTSLNHGQEKYLLRNYGPILHELSDYFAWDVYKAESFIKLLQDNPSFCKRDLSFKEFSAYLVEAGTLGAFILEKTGELK